MTGLDLDIYGRRLIDLKKALKDASVALEIAREIILDDMTKKYLIRQIQIGA